MHVGWKYVEKYDINVHFDSFTKILASRSTAYDQKSSIATVFLNEFYSIFEFSECIDLNFKFFFENFCIKFIFFTLNLRVKPDKL